MPLGWSKGLAKKPRIEYISSVGSAKLTGGAPGLQIRCEVLKGVSGGFDSHALPPTYEDCPERGFFIFDLRTHYVREKQFSLGTLWCVNRKGGYSIRPLFLPQKSRARYPACLGKMLMIPYCRGCVLLPVCGGKIDGQDSHLGGLVGNRIFEAEIVSAF